MPAPTNKNQAIPKSPIDARRRRLMARAQRSASVENLKLRADSRTKAVVALPATCSIGEAADALGLSKRTIRRLVDRGEIYVYPASRRGVLMLDVQSIRNWMDRVGYGRRG